MKKYFAFFVSNLSVTLLAAILLISGCGIEEHEVTPQQSCDTQAVVRIKKGCGLIFQLKNKQILLPVNALPIEKSSAGVPQYKVNGFVVKDGEHVIIGFSKKGLVTNSCYEKQIQVVGVTCIVGYEAQP